jgi:hypothetical protein
MREWRYCLMKKESEKKIVLLEYMIVVLDFYVAEKV